jgi:hypothetical protein
MGKSEGEQRIIELLEIQVAITLVSLGATRDRIARILKMRKQSLIKLIDGFESGSVNR